MRRPSSIKLKPIAIEYRSSASSCRRRRRRHFAICARSVPLYMFLNSKSYCRSRYIGYLVATADAQLWGFLGRLGRSTHVCHDQSPRSFGIGQGVLQLAKWFFRVHMLRTFSTHAWGYVPNGFGISFLVININIACIPLIHRFVHEQTYGRYIEKDRIISSEKLVIICMPVHEDVDILNYCESKYTRGRPALRDNFNVDEIYR
jgi:hypothetical protein